MKKVKVLFMITVLATMLCSCSFLGEPQLTKADLASMTDEELESLIEEGLEADWDDCLIQIDKTILWLDYTMTLEEVITALQDSGVEYRFTLDLGSYDSEPTDYNADTIVSGKDSISIWVLKGDEIYFVIGAKNTSDETVKASDAAVIFDCIQTFDKYPHVYRNMYYCHGLRADGG